MENKGNPKKAKKKKKGKQELILGKKPGVETFFFFLAVFKGTPDTGKALHTTLQCVGSLIHAEVGSAARPCISKHPRDHKAPPPPPTLKGPRLAPVRAAQPQCERHATGYNLTDPPLGTFTDISKFEEVAGRCHSDRKSFAGLYDFRMSTSWAPNKLSANGN